LVYKRYIGTPVRKADCHVHFYDNYSPSVFLETAKKNLETGGILFFTHRFGLAPDWKTVYPTFETISEGIGRVDGITFVSGYQIVTSEKIEILNLASSTVIEDGLRAKDVLLKVDGVPVIPWSPGKWLGERGKIIKSLANDVYCGKILYKHFLADFKVFKGVLPGSDPLPREGEERLVGRIGVVGDREINSLESARSFLKGAKSEFGSELTVAESVFRYLLW